MTEVRAVTLTDFLLARIAEDVRWARSCWPKTSPTDARPMSRERVLAEIEAKRQIVETYAANYWPDPGDTVLLGGAHAAVAPARVIRLLASVYADHPDYDDEWRL